MQPNVTKPAHVHYMVTGLINKPSVFFTLDSWLSVR
jgi:hypothetical protein